MARERLTKTYDDRGPEERQVVTFVSPKLNAEEWDELSTYLFTLLVNAVNERSTLNNNLLIWNDLYEGRIPQGKSFPWPDSANINVPVTQEMLDGLLARLSKTVLGVEPVVLVKGDDQEGVDVQFKVERYFDALDRTIHFREAMQDAIFLGLRDGVGLMKVVWDYRTRKIRTRKHVPVSDALGPIVNPATGRPYKRESIEIEEIIEWDNVRVLPVELKDFYLLPSHAYSINPIHAKGVAERIWMRWDEIYAKGQSGMYDPAQVDKLKDMTTSSRLYTLGVNFLEQDTIGGYVTISQTPGLQEYEVFEVVMSYDLDKDGYEEECLFTFCPRYGVMLRAEVLPYWHQMRPYIAVVPWPRANRFYGFGIPERLESVNRELNAIHNQRLDVVSIRIAPPILVKKSAITLGNASQPWGPGMRFEVNETGPQGDITPLHLPDVDPSSFTEENILRQYAERIVGMYDVNTPRGTGSRRTRAEIGAIQEEGMVRFDRMAKLLQLAIVAAHNQILQLKIQYMPDTEDFEATGPAGGMQKFQIERGELMGHFHFVANGDLPVADKERFRQESYFLYGALMQNPLVIQKPTRIYAVTQNLLQAWESKNIEKMIGTVEEVQQEEQQVEMAQQIQMRMGGGAPGATPGQRTPGNRPGGPGNVPGMVRPGARPAGPARTPAGGAGPQPPRLAGGPPGAGAGPR